MRPDGAIIAMLKSPTVNARYRKSVKGERPAWYIPEENVDTLHRDLSTATQLPGGQIETLCAALAPYATQPSEDDLPDQEPSMANQSENADSDDDDGGAALSPESQVGPPRKRMRVTEARMHREPPCRACVYEAEMIARGGGFREMYHTCIEGSQF